MKNLMGGLKIYTTMNRSMQEYSEGVISDPDNYLFEESIDANNIVQPQVATVITEPATGHIKTVVGGRGEQVIGGPNRAVSSNFLRAVGSSTKPLTVYAPGIDKKIFDAATVFEDSPLSKEQRVNISPETLVRTPAIPDIREMPIFHGWAMSTCGMLWRCPPTWSPSKRPCWLEVMFPKNMPKIRICTSP